MLRQIHIFQKDSMIFTHTFALALGKEEIQNLITTSESNSLDKKEKIIQQTLSNYQVFEATNQDLRYFFITDLVDKLEFLKDIINKAIIKFEDLFPDLAEIDEYESSKEMYISILHQLQAELHSKIALIGPIDAGKTTLYQLITDQQQERNIMNFAKSSIIKLYDLQFDIWDFQINDNYALLWSKFISGSDMVIFIIDAANYNLKVINHFLSLKKRENPQSKMMVILNKLDLIENEDTFIDLEKELNASHLLKVSLQKEASKSTVLSEISTILNLKTKLPDDFESLLQEAKQIEKERNYGKALAKYKELIRYVSNYQDFTQIARLEQKAEELEQKLREQAEIRKKIELKKKFAPPAQIKFEKKVKVKNFSKKKPQEVEQASRKLKPSDIKLDISVLRNTQERITSVKQKQVELSGEESSTAAPKHEEKSKVHPEDEYEDISEVPDKAVLLQKMIESRGSNLSLKLCSQFIEEMNQSLQRDLRLSDLKIAADNFLSLEKH
ncbi:MAG: putative Small GTP-binding domain protein, ARF-domain signature [Promethearchaeota archaeon]|nr:MAG: putative Small GTP-binding domain protein, ARF-domain signature [Candidatus Lokiarchaeota archaeon]